MDVISELLRGVFQLLKEESCAKMKKYLQKQAEIFVDKCMQELNVFFTEKIPEWAPLVQDTIANGLEWGREKLLQLKGVILAICKKYASQIIAITEATAPVTTVVVKETGRALASRVTSKATTEVVEVAVKKVAAEAAEMSAAQALKSFRAVTIKSVAAGAATPVGVVADAAQLGLEVAGYKKTGKTVGCVGNMAAASMTGFVLGGPIGAGIGAMTGLGLWTAGEAIGYCIVKGGEKIVSFAKSE